MRSLEEIDPGLLDQAIRRLLAKPRAIDKEAAISAHMEKSAELKEWVEMVAQAVGPMATKLNLTVFEAHQAQLYVAFALGLEVGYVLYERELER
jgi:hypothetical protein